MLYSHSNWRNVRGEHQEQRVSGFSFDSLTVKALLSGGVGGGGEGAPKREGLFEREAYFKSNFRRNSQ